MIAGTVSSALEAVIRLHVADSNGQTQALDVKIDTGFSDFMSLPVAIVASLGLKWSYRATVQVGDGRTVRADVYTARIDWDGRSRLIDVQALGVERLIGMALLAGHDLVIRVTDGGAIRIEAIP
jgi:clan AA aspartic protease